LPEELSNQDSCDKVIFSEIGEVELLTSRYYAFTTQPCFRAFRHLPGTDAQIKKYRYAQMGQAVALVLALASEIEAHFNFGLREDAVSIWKVAAPAIVVVNEVYQKRYRELLG
jgi:hypothetical protein